MDDGVHGRRRLLLRGRDVAPVVDVDDSFVLQILEDGLGSLVVLRHLVVGVELLHGSRPGRPAWPQSPLPVASRQANRP